MTPESFWGYVDATGDCWQWTGRIEPSGYAHARTQTGRKAGVHRIAWELLIGPISAGLVIDHLCRNRSCVNPDHLEPVTPSTNTRRSAVPLLQLNKTHCPRGHAYDDVNTWLSPKGYRTCRTCHRDRERSRQRAMKGVA